MPWALADAARVSLAYGTEFNRADATDQDLLQILNAYGRFDRRWPAASSPPATCSSMAAGTTSSPSRADARSAPSWAGPTSG